MFTSFSLLLLILSSLLLFLPVSCQDYSLTGRVSTLSLSSPITNPTCLSLTPFDYLYGCESGISNRCFQIRDLPQNSSSASLSSTVDFLSLLPDAGSADGDSSSAQFNGPHGIEYLWTQPNLVKLFIADTGNHAIRLMTIRYSSALFIGVSFAPSSVIVVTLAGLKGSQGNANGLTTAARFFSPKGLALARGGLFIADSNNHIIRYLPIVNDSTLLSPSGALSQAQISATVTTAAGTAGLRGLNDGLPSVSLLSSPTALSVFPSSPASLSSSFPVISEYSNPAALIYVAHQHAIASLNSTNYLSHLVGSSSNGYLDSSGFSARFQSPSSIVWDLLGNGYIADAGNNRVRVLKRDTKLTRTLIGNNKEDLIDGVPSLASLAQPLSIAVYRSPSLSERFFIADSGHDAIRVSTAVCDLPCKNGGLCTSTSLCSCAGNWTDIDCSVAICTSGCPPGQLCLAPNVCGCPSGYTGAACTIPICPASCQNGTCSAPNVCSCNSGWSSSVVNGPCNTAICSQPCAHGVCVAPDTCQCSAGWSGPLCDRAICSLPCQNGFSCVAPNTCNCSSQYTQIDCSEPVCQLPCLNGGNCTAPDTCTCPAGLYSGPQCQTPVCSPSCLNGNCVAPNVCNCSLGWNGTLCDSAICDLPCQNGGNCTSPNHCTCPIGWDSAIDCSNPVCTPACFEAPPFSPARPFQTCSPTAVYTGLSTAPPPACFSGCIGRPCLNGGYCIASDTCDCVGFWSNTATIKNCSVPVCPGGCSHGGLCTGPATCSCQAGYYPPESAVGAPGCSEIACSCSNGRCFTPYNCTCDAGWLFDSVSGNCSIPICSFPSLSYVGCANNGTCVLPNQCSCRPGWTDGQACLTPQCSPSCQNGGRCVAPDTCVCPPEYQGPGCLELIPSPQDIFQTYYSLFIIAFGVIAGFLALGFAWFVRKRKDLLKKRKFAYASEFDARKEILREKKRKNKEKAKLAAEKGAGSSLPSFLKSKRKSVFGEDVAAGLGTKSRKSKRSKGRRKSMYKRAGSSGADIGKSELELGVELDGETDEYGGEVDIEKDEKEFVGEGSAATGERARLIHGSSGFGLTSESGAFSGGSNGRDSNYVAVRMNRAHSSYAESELGLQLERDDEEFDEEERKPNIPGAID